MANVQEIIANAANKYGVPVEALLAIAKIESNFNADAANPNSTASGLFQFTDGTAGDMGLTGDKRNDAEAQAEAAAKMAASNSRSLTATLGRAPTAGELYLAHQQGLAGAKALLSNPNAPASEVLARFHGGNAAKAITQNGGNLNMTAGEFANQWVNKGNKTAALYPPGELPQVGTALSTVATPRQVTPVTPSIDMALMRKGTVPSQFLPDTFASLAKRPQTQTRSADLSVMQKNSVTPFLTRDGQGVTDPAALALYGRNPDYLSIGSLPQTQANIPRPVPPMPTGVAQSYAGQDTFKAQPKAAPSPAMMSPQMAGQRARNDAPEVTAALNARYPAQLPPLPPPMNAMPRPQVPGNSFAGQDSFKAKPMTVADMYRGIYPTEPGQFRIGSTDGLGPGVPGGQYSTAGLTGAVNERGLPVTSPIQVASRAPTPFPRPPSFPTQFAAAKVAPVPFPRPTAVGTALDVMPMPPLPIPRPRIAPIPFDRPNFGMGGPAGPRPVAPRPMPANMRPPAPNARPPLQIVVNGGNNQPSRPTPQGYTDAGNGKIIHDESGGIYFARHLNK